MNTRFLVTAAGRLTVAGAAPKETASSPGGGADLFLGLGPSRGFVAFGLALGFDLFGRKTEDVAR